MKIRGFELVEKEFKKHDFKCFLPVRGSRHSAGYDFVTPIDIDIPAGSTSDLIFTDVKAYMKEGEVLQLHVRSSIGIKRGVALANTTGIIDADYYSNPDNDGNIGFKLRNLSDRDVHIEAGERVIQGIFTPYLVADNGNTGVSRQGGFGSTNR